MINSSPPRAVPVRAFGLFAAIAVLLGLYYWVHKPFDTASGLLIAGALLDLLTAVLIVMLAGGIGRRALLLFDRRFPLDLPSLHPAERLALEAGIGLGALALIALALGLAGLFGAIWGAAVLLAALCFPAPLTYLRDARRAIGAIRVRGGWELTCAALLVIGLGLALPVAFAPPIHWDALTYHLVGIDRALTSGRIVAHPDNFYLGFPENVEMIFAYAVGLFGRDTAAAVIHFAYGVIGVAAVAGVCARYLGRTGAWTAIGLLFSAYNFALLFGWPYVDLGAFAYGALLLIAATRWRDTGSASEASSTGWALLMGAAVGLACGVKYTAGFIGLSALSVALFWRPRQFPRTAALITLAAVIAFGLWAVKGLVLYGNPIYPLIFNGLEWDSGRAALFSFNERSLVKDGLWWQIPVLPLAATVFGQDLTDGYGFTAGAWLLTLWIALPIVEPWLDDRARALGRLSVALLVPVILVWGGLSAYSVVGQQTRLLLVALPFCAAGGAVMLHGLAKFPHKPLHLDWMIRVLFTVTAALTVLDLVRNFSRDQAAPYLLGLISVQDYRIANLSSYPLMIDRLAELPPETRVRFIFEPRAYDCPDQIVCVGDLLFDHWSRPQAAGATAAETLAAYRAAGDDYWLVFDTGYRAYLDVSQRRTIDEGLAAALEQAFVPVWTDGINYTLYTWRDE